MNTNDNQRVINISQTQVMAMRQSGVNKKQMADYYGITVQEMHQVMTTFGIYKSKPENERSYEIVLHRDFVNPLTMGIDEFSNSENRMSPGGVPHDHSNDDISVSDNSMETEPAYTEQESGY